MIIGYGFTTHEKMKEMKALFNQYNCEKIYIDFIENDDKKSEFINMIEALCPDDLLIINSINDVANTKRDLNKFMKLLLEKRIIFQSISEEWFTNKNCDVVNNVIKGLLNFDSSIKSKKTKIGLEKARSRGKNGGRPKLKEDKIGAALLMYDSLEYSISDIIKETGVSKTTLYNYLRKRNKK